MIVIIKRFHPLQSFPVIFDSLPLEWRSTPIKPDHKARLPGEPMASGGPGPTPTPSRSAGCPRKPALPAPPASPEQGLSGTFRREGQLPAPGRTDAGRAEAVAKPPPLPAARRPPSALAAPAGRSPVASSSPLLRQHRRGPARSRLPSQPALPLGRTMREVAGLVLAVAAAVAILSAEVLDDARRAAGRLHLPRRPAQDSTLPVALHGTPGRPETAAAAIFAMGRARAAPTGNGGAAVFTAGSCGGFPARPGNLPHL